MTSAVIELSRGIAKAALAVAFACALGLSARAQARAPAAPTFFDTARPLEKPDLSTLRQIRFLTEDDFPPFNFASPDGRIVGFNVDLARAICDELGVSCTIQRRRWDLLVPSLNDGGGDAVIASLAMNEETRKQVDFTAPYLTTPGRFVLRLDSVLKGASPEDIGDRSIAVVGGSVHEAFLKAIYPKAKAAPYEDAAQARKALKTGRVHGLFGDAASLSFWLNGAEAENCCGFKGGPYTDPRYFGDGLGIAVKKGAGPLRRALDYALARIAQRGVFSEIYLKYFPVGPF